MGRWSRILRIALFLGVLLLVFVDSMNFYDGWDAVGALVGQVALILMVVYLVRWLRYPGLFQGATNWELTSRFLMALFVFTGGVFVCIVLFRVHLIKEVPFDDIGHWLGLEFKFKKWQQVKVLGEGGEGLGIVRDVRVVKRDEVRGDPMSVVGTVYYVVALDSGDVSEEPEQVLVKAYSFPFNIRTPRVNS